MSLILEGKISKISIKAPNKLSIDVRGKITSGTVAYLDDDVEQIKYKRRELVKADLKGLDLLNIDDFTNTVETRITAKQPKDMSSIPDTQISITVSCKDHAVLMILSKQVIDSIEEKIDLNLTWEEKEE